LPSGRRKAARAQFIDDFQFPPGIRERVRKRYPQLNDAQLERVMAVSPPGFS
jgi:hypothetical protein